MLSHNIRDDQKNLRQPRSVFNDKYFPFTQIPNTMLVLITSRVV